MRPSSRRLGIAVLLAATAAAGGSLPPRAKRSFSDPVLYAPVFREIVNTSELRDLVDRYGADRALLLRFHGVPGSASRRKVLRGFYQGWQRTLLDIDFDGLSQEGRVDHILLRAKISSELDILRQEERLIEAIFPLVPFSPAIAALQEARQRLDFIAADDAVAALRGVLGRLGELRAAVSAGSLKAGPGLAVKAARHLDDIRDALDEWYSFYQGYHPEFTAKAPPVWKALGEALDAYSADLREKLAGLPPGTRLGRRAGSLASRGEAGRASAGGAPDDAAGQSLVLGEPIVGDPVGRETLIELLRGEMIVYSPEDLILIGEREYAWCETEMKKASREMGCGDDWRAALEQVKSAHVPRGEQPALVRDLALQAEGFILERDLVSVPAVARDGWRLTMMAPQTMRSAPFFLGGESIQVSYPVEGMSEDLALMIMKGNSPHLSHATVFHELIPGHMLQGFMAQRYNTHRSVFQTPFYGEGWALHWEMLMWDLGFHATPQDRIGALFWRMHRAGRIIFTLNYQMGKWTPRQCIDFLISNGHEPYTAEGEVRGHIQNSPPLYQVSYMVGGLQLRSIYLELVAGSKAMTPKQFHDAFLKTGPMPMELVRALLGRKPLTRDFRPAWEFYGAIGWGAL